MTPRTLLRLEGAAMFLLATAVYGFLDGAVWRYILFVLLPDLSMIGYLHTARTGSIFYNLIHTYVLPFGIGAAAFWTNQQVVLLSVLPWIAHIGIDRSLQYGLKYYTGFADTHLQQV